MIWRWHPWKKPSSLLFIWRGQSLQIQVAKAALEARLHEAIRLYQEEAERLINHCGRENYAAAAMYLKEVKDIYLRLKEPLVWQKAITGLRERYRNIASLER